MKTAKMTTRQIYQVLLLVIAVVIAAVYVTLNVYKASGKIDICAVKRLSPLLEEFAMFPKPDTSVMSDQPSSIHKPKIEHCNVYDLNGKNDHSFNCINTKTTPSVPMCLHDLEKDTVISGSLLQYGVFDQFVSDEVREELKNDPEMGYIDIGANIGVMVLPVAKSGHKVVAVEPIMDNIFRLQKSAQLANTTDNIILVRNALADVRSWGLSSRNPTNLGGSPVFVGNGIKCKKNCHVDLVDTIYMDDLLEVIPFKKAVIKIDCEGCEDRALIKGQKLLDQLQVKKIVMEWGNRGSAKPEEQEGTKKMIKMLLSKGFIARTVIGEGHVCDLNHEMWPNWPWNVAWYRN